MINRVETKEELEEDHVKNSDVIVVIDTFMFCSTVLSIFESGVKRVKVFKEYKEKNFPFGGDTGYDFKNSPQSVYGKNFDCDVVGITSDNGAICCMKISNMIDNLNDRPIILASTVNYKAIAEFCNGKDVCIVQSGSKGSFRLEDNVASILISNKILNKDIGNRDILPDIVEQVTRQRYKKVSEEDINKIIDFGSSNIVPISENKFNDHLEFVKETN